MKTERIGCWPVLFVLIVLASGAVAEERSASEQRNVALVMRLFDAGWGANQGWEQVWGEVMSEDLTTYFHAQPPNRGLSAAIAFNEALFKGFPALEVSVQRVVAEGDRVIVESLLSGVHTGPFLGVPASHEGVVDLPDVTLLRVQDGRVTEWRYFTDLIAVMTTIGALPGPD